VNRAVSAGITAGTRNRVDLQAAPVAITGADIYFSDRLSDNTTTFPFGYLPAAAANPATARYVLCARAQTGIATWFMQVLEGFIGAASTPNAVGAWATATTAPAQTSCGIPLGICKKPGSTGPDWGFTAGEWVSGASMPRGLPAASVDRLSPPAGARKLAALLAGQGMQKFPVGQTGIIGNAAASMELPLWAVSRRRRQSRPHYGAALPQWLFLHAHELAERSERVFGLSGKA
jgi:hypothetical protein